MKRYLHKPTGRIYIKSGDQYKWSSFEESWELFAPMYIVECLNAIDWEEVGAEPKDNLIEAAPLMFSALTELIEIRQQRMISGDTRELMEKEAEAYNRAYVAIEKAVPKVTYGIPAYPSDY